MAAEVMEHARVSSLLIALLARKKGKGSSVPKSVSATEKSQDHFLKKQIGFLLFIADCLYG